MKFNMHTDNGKDIIAGAGLTGLSCGYILKNCLILEKNSYIGGLAHTFSYKNFRFDIGGHRFLTRQKDVQDLVTNLLNNDLIIINRKSKIFKNKKFLDYPPTYSIILDIPVFLSFSIFFSYIFRKIFPLKETSFKESTINRFGDALYYFYFKNYTEKIWGIPCDNISKDWIEVRLPKLSLRRAINSIFFKNKFNKTFSESFFYPKFGIGQIPDKLSLGLNIESGSEITAIEHDGKMIKTIITNNNAKHKCKNFISTIPINSLVEMLKAPLHVRNAAKNLKYRDIMCVFLIFDSKAITDLHWIYFPDTQNFGRLHEPKNWSKCLAPDGQTALCLEIFCNRSDNIWQMQDKDIVNNSIKDLPFKQKTQISDSHVIRIENAYPIYDLCYRNNLKIVMQFLDNFKNLYIAGRTGRFDYINMDDCIKEGLKIGNFLNKKS